MRNGPASFHTPTIYWGIAVWGKPFDFCYIAYVRPPLKMVSICFSYVESRSDYQRQDTSTFWLEPKSYQVGGMEG